MLQREFEEILIHFLKDNRFLLMRTLPIKLIDLYHLIQEQDDFPVMSFLGFEESCGNLSYCLPSLFVLETLSPASSNVDGCRYQLCFFDILALESWLIGWSLDSTLDAVSDLSSGPSTPSLTSHHDSLDMLASESPMDHVVQLSLETSSYTTKLRKELDQFLTFDTAKTRLRREQITSNGEKGFVSICNKGSRSECLVAGRLQCREKIHFERVITANTDPSLGDCSYLDTCYKGKTCKFVHYKISYPDIRLLNNDRDKQFKPVVGYFDTPEYPAVVPDPSPPQWINSDIRKLNFTKLGQFSAILADRTYRIVRIAVSLVEQTN